MLLGRKVYFVKEQVEFLKLSGTYDIFDPETNIKIGVAKEEPGNFIKFLKLLVDKRLLPTKVVIYDSEINMPVAEIKKSAMLFRSKVSVMDKDKNIIGYFRSKFFSLGGGFMILDTQNKIVGEIKGDWKGWNFKFLTFNGQELGTITKKWSGLGKELFTSADNYIISINETEQNDVLNTLVLAAGIAIDIIFKEGK